MLRRTSNIQMVHTKLLCVCKIYKSEVFVVSELGIRNVVSLLGWVIKKWSSALLGKTFFMLTLFGLGGGGGGQNGPLEGFCKISQQRCSRSSRNFMTFKTII